MNVQILFILLTTFTVGNSLYCCHCNGGDNCTNLKPKNCFTLSCNRTGMSYRGIFPTDFLPTLRFPEIGNSTNGQYQCLSAGNNSVTNRFCVKATDLMVKRICDGFLHNNGKFCNACKKDDCNGSNSASVEMFMVLVSSFLFVKNLL